MASMISELQQGALDRSTSVTDLLRRALVAARKLNLQEFAKWVQNELDGYADGSDIPEYRQVIGEIKGWNPYRGWVPVMFQDAGVTETLSKRKITQSISELEALLSRKSEILHVPFPPELVQRIIKSIGMQTQVTLFVPGTSVVGIVENVQNIVLNWSLKLEDEGIHGEGLSFSPTEKEAAQHSIQNINNFFGPVTDSQVQQGLSQSIQIRASDGIDIPELNRLVSMLAAGIAKMTLPAASKQEIDSEIETINAQVKSPKPKASIIRESFRSIRAILENAGGTIAAQLLVELGKFLF